MAKVKTKKKPDDKLEYRGSLDVVGPSLELAEIMAEQPKIIEKELVRKGDDLIGIYIDPNATTRVYKELYDVQQEILEQAIDDIAKGILLLRGSTIGVMTSGGKALPYVVPHGSQPDGNVILSINWKDMVAFKNWRTADGTDDIPQETLNAAVYRLTVALSQVIKAAHGK
jgi:hypothetical protein